MHPSTDDDDAGSTGPSVDTDIGMKMADAYMPETGVETAQLFFHQHRRFARRLTARGERCSVVINLRPSDGRFYAPWLSSMTKVQRQFVALFLMNALQAALFAAYFRRQHSTAAFHSSRRRIRKNRLQARRGNGSTTLPVPLVEKLKLLAVCPW